MVGKPYYRFYKMDTNNDNVISVGEWNVAHPWNLISKFRGKLDPSGDHVLSSKEFLSWYFGLS